MAYIGADPIVKGTGLFSQDTFTGDGSTTTFDMTNAAPDGGGNEIQVFVDNVRQQEGSSNAYTLGQDGSGDLKRITFTTAPLASQSIFVLNPGTKNVQQVSTVSDNTVTTAKIQANAVTVAKLASTLNLSSNTVTLPNDVVNADKIADDAISEEHLDNTALTGHGELSATAASDDVLLVFDTDASLLKKIQVSNINSSPTITSISPTTVQEGDGTGNHTFVITGTNYASGATAFFRNASGTEVGFDTVTRNSITQITAVIAKSSLPGSGEPYDIVVENSNGQQARKRNQVNINQSPAFVTAAGSLGTVADGARSGKRFTVVATDPESAGNVTFELQSGVIPVGLTLSNEGSEGGTAVLSGNLTEVASDTTYNFVLRAVDAASNTSSRAFSLTVNSNPIKTFTSSGTLAIPTGVSTADILVVAGGGTGGFGTGTGGGGAGGLVYYPSAPVTPGGTVVITVGCGGAPAGSGPQIGNGGQNSVFGASPSPGTPLTLTAQGGGRGGNDYGGAASPGGSAGGGMHNGGRSPGGSADQPTAPGASGQYGFGNNGGQGSPGAYGGGGGGGAGSAGGQSPSANTAGAGGQGRSYSIADGTTSVAYAGGGGGGISNTGTNTGGGPGGGGNGSDQPNSSGQAGQANKGGGGGGSRGPTGGAGGKGIVIVKFP